MEMDTDTLVTGKVLLTSWVLPDEKLADFIIDPYQDGIRHGHKPILNSGKGRKKRFKG